MVIIRFTILFTIVLLKEQYDTLEYSKVKCSNSDSMRLRNLYSIGHKKCQQAFLAPLSGKQLAKDIVNSLINFTSLSPLILAGLHCSRYLLIVAEQCMTGF